MADLKRYHKIGRIPRGITVLVGFDYFGNVYASPGVIKHIKKRHSNHLSTRILYNIPGTIKDIIRHPDFIGVKSSEKGLALELIKVYDKPILLALDVDKVHHYIYVASMYPISDSKFESKLYSGCLKNIDY